MNIKNSVSVWALSVAGVGHLLLAAVVALLSVRGWSSTIAFILVCNGAWVYYELYGYRSTRAGLASTVAATASMASFGALGLVLGNMILLGVVSPWTRSLGAVVTFTGFIMMTSGLVQHYRLKAVQLRDSRQQNDRRTVR
ncbi:MAG TPA: hypothetical protein H9881_02355 [Candidatus Stackebrandtia excrementipullorum]|nr:hypothetical protein [Candidatus Stackebrandtia excrementipullorum]